MTPSTPTNATHGPESFALSDTPAAALEGVTKLLYEIEQLRLEVKRLRLAKGPALFDEMMTAVLRRAEAAEAERDDLRARLAKVEALADKWEHEAEEIRQSEGEERDGPSAGMVGIAHGRHKSAVDLRAAMGGDV